MPNPRDSENDLQSFSPASFVSAYGESGFSDAVSNIGKSFWSPYTAQLEANTTLCTFASAAALSTLCVPTTFVSATFAGFEIDSITDMFAARWQTDVAPEKARFRSAGRVTSPLKMFFLLGENAGDGFEKLSKTRTSRPSDARSSDRWEPMKPAPPVTTTFMVLAPQEGCYGLVSSSHSAFNRFYA